MAASGCSRVWLDGRGTATTLEEANNIIIVKIKLREFVSDHQNKLSPMDLNQMGRVTRKSVFGVSDQVRHISDCTVTEDG